MERQATTTLTPGAFVSRLDPSKTSAAQLVYSTFLGGSRHDSAHALSIDAIGVVTVAGRTLSPNFPTTKGAYDTTHNGNYDVSVSRLSMGVALWADRYELSLKQGGTQTLTLNAGRQHANKLYILVGTLSGTKPGIPLGHSVTLPLNPDPYFTLTLLAANSPMLTKTLGKLDASGSATAKWNVIPRLPQVPAKGFLLHHAYVVMNASALTFDFASNAVPLRLVK